MSEVNKSDSDEKTSKKVAKIIAKTKDILGRSTSREFKKSYSKEKSGNENILINNTV